MQRTISLLALLLLAERSAYAVGPATWREVRVVGQARTDDDRIAIAGYRDEYDDGGISTPEWTITRRGRRSAAEAWRDFKFGRFQSPGAVKGMLGAACRHRRPLRPHRGRDGRRGLVSSTRLGGDWVLAESEQVAPSCTSEQILLAYLDGRLQKVWNADKVLDCKFTRMQRRGSAENCDDGEAYYRQDLVLRSQRIIREHTGVMRYSQAISIEKIGTGGNYCVSVRLANRDDGDAATALTTARKPFDSLQVYIGLQQQGADVHIYAAGIMEVNRRVVPNLIVFDASGIAGSMAGKGTLWLAAFFEREKEKKKSLAAFTTRLPSLRSQSRKKNSKAIARGLSDLSS